jgi:hypothetical protein
MDLSDLTTRDVVEAKLVGLEPEMLEYIVTMLEDDKSGFVDDETNAYLTETIGSLLCGSEFCAGEEAATRLARGLIINLSVLSASKAATSHTAPPPAPAPAAAAKTKIATPAIAATLPQPVSGGAAVKATKIKEPKEPKAPKAPKESKGTKDAVCGKESTKSSKKLSASERAEQLELELEEGMTSSICYI